MARHLLDLDTQALLWINSHHSVWLDALLMPVAWAGELAAIWVVLCLCALIFGRKEQRILAMVLLAAILITDRLIAAPIGTLVPRTRPYLALEGVRQMGIAWHSGSFPSGHAHSVWIATILLGARHRMLVVPLVLFALLTCISRPYSGMHYPGDVLGGSLIGIASGTVTAVLYGRMMRWMELRSASRAGQAQAT